MPARRSLALGAEGRPGVVALAFHVDYWDSLGWKDRSPAPRTPQRQSQQQATSGARFSYTPQVIVDGADRKDWPGIAGAAQAPRCAVDVPWRAKATASPRPSPPPRRAEAARGLLGRHRARPRHRRQGGREPRRHLAPRLRGARLPAGGGLVAAAGRRRRCLPAGAAADAAHPREVDLVVVDAATGRPVQAAEDRLLTRVSRGAQLRAQLGADLRLAGERVGRVARLDDVLQARLHAGERLGVAVDVEAVGLDGVEDEAATSAALTLPLPTAFSLIALPISWLRVGLSAASASGRLRSLSVMPVGTKNGHSTEAPIWSVTRRRSW